MRSYPPDAASQYLLDSRARRLARTPDETQVRMQSTLREWLAMTPEFGAKVFGSERAWKRACVGLSGRIGA